MPERNITSKSWLDVIESHDLRVFEQIITTNNHTTYLCFLMNDYFTVRGAGKGKNDEENQTSARYEALEHYLSGSSFRKYPSILATRKVISQQYNLLLIRCDVARLLSSVDDDPVIPWVIYQEITTGREYAVPIAAVDLSYNLAKNTADDLAYDHYDFFAASNGLANGATYEDALIHSVLEILERDAYSYLLIDTFILKKPVYIIDKQSLPTDLLELVYKIENDFQDELVILQMPSRFNVFAYCAAFTNKKFPVQPRGSGASLNRRIALERSIYECIQTYNLMQNHFQDSHIANNKQSDSALVRDILTFDIAKLLQQQQFQLVAFIDNTQEYTAIDSKKYLNKLIYLIEQQSSMLLVNKLYGDNQNSLTCVRCIIPDAEEFFLVGHYLKMNPKLKTASYIEAHLGKPFNWDNFIEEV